MSSVLQRCFFLIGFLIGLFSSAAAYAQSLGPGEPIAFVGHGRMFGAGGDEITPTIPFIGAATQWYISELSKGLTPDQRAEFEAFRRSLVDGLTLDDQAKLVVNTRLIDWLLERSPRQLVDQVRPKNNAIRSLLRSSLRSSGGANPSNAEFLLPPELAARLVKDRRDNVAKKKKANPALFDVTLEEGVKYRLECSSKGVPIPPDFGPNSAWVKQGTIMPADLFIVRSISADVLTYTSTSPKGICVALPRYDANNEVQLDGVICTGLDTSNVCFFDNQAGPDDVFTFQNGTAQPFSKWAGGTALFASNGGVCTDCHAGENPYIIHGPLLTKLRNEQVIMPPQQYNPIVRGEDGGRVWPQNVGAADSPQACSGCHGQPDEVMSDAGRFPKLSQKLPGYCGTILRSSVGALMPPIPGKLNAPPSMPPGSKAGTYACTPALPATDPRYRACSALTTLDCTPKVDCTVDPAIRNERCGQPDFPAAYKVSCTADVKALLTACEQPE